MLSRLSECPASQESEQPHPSGHRIIKRKETLVAISMWYVLDAVWKAGAGRW